MSDESHEEPKPKMRLRLGVSAKMGLGNITRIHYSNPYSRVWIWGPKTLLFGYLDPFWLEARETEVRTGSLQVRKFSFRASS